MNWPGPVTNRQYVAWVEWSNSQMYEPDRSDYYAMQTALEVRCMSQPGKTHNLTDMLLAPKGRQGSMTEEELDRESKARAIAVATKGGKVKLRRVEVSADGRT